jgi:DNA-binding beta-propeller fold protein YncE
VRTRLSSRNKNLRILKFSPSGPNLEHPSSLSMGSCSGNGYVADSTTDRIVKFWLDGTVTQTFTTTTPALYPYGVAVDNSNNVYVAFLISDRPTPTARQMSDQV